jgi:hypothetical protein
MGNVAPRITSFVATFISVLALTAGVLAFAPVTHAATSVTDEASLQTALASSTVSAITIANSFPVDTKIIISRPVTIDGGNNTITFSTSTPTTWHGNYVFEVYNTSGVTISNIKLTGGNAALLVNSSTVTLTGAIDVSGNGFGGIESSKGGGLTTLPSLIVSSSTLTNTSEAYGLPTIWEDLVTGTVTGFPASGTSSPSVKTGQVQYYLNPTSLTNVTVGTQTALNAALANTAITNITFSGDITATSSVQVTHKVTIDGAGHKLLPSFTKTSSSNNAAMIILNDDGVTVKNLTVDGGDKANGHALHGFNIYNATNVLLDGVTASNNQHTGVNVNGSTVTVNNITTSSNLWGGINIDQGTGLTATTTLTVNGTSHQTETGADIWRDDNSKTTVTLVDTNNQYSAITYSHSGIVGTIWNIPTQITATTSPVVVTSVTQPIAVTVTSGVTNATINVSSLVTSGTGTLPQITVTSDAATVSISASTTVTSSDTSWNGIITAPVATSTYAAPTPVTGQTTTVAAAIEIGAGNTPLSFSNPVKLVFTGKGGDLAGWSQGGVFHAIAATCSSATNPVLTGNDCSITVGSDLIVWTKHFSTFIAYTQAATPVVQVIQGSGGGSGSGPALVRTPANSSAGASTASTGTGSVTTTAAGTVSRGQVLGASTFNFTRNLMVGLRGDDVTQLQTMLIAEGYLNIAAPTGYFGALTKTAVIKHQKAHGINGTGFVGARTLAQLNAGVMPTASDSSVSTKASIQAQINALQAQLAQLMAASTSSSTATH